MTAVLFAVASALGFTGSGLLALAGRGLGEKAKPYFIAVAAGILLALSFGDFLPESLDLAGKLAIAGFAGGFMFMFLAESLTGPHSHAEEPSGGKSAVTPLVLGLAVHNFTDGFVLGASTNLPQAASGFAGLGIFVHQVPTGLSLAAILIASGLGRGRSALVTVLLGLVIPLATLLTLALPAVGDVYPGILTGAAGGVLTYLGAAHLLPDLREGEVPALKTAVVFAASLAATTAAVLTVLGG